MARKETVSITSAAPSHSDELWSRQKRYLISMGIRTVCFVGFVLVDHPTRWIMLGAAIFLPYFAVVLANAGGIWRPTQRPEFVQVDRPALESSSDDD